MQHATFETPEVSLHYITQGEGPDIVWCPGGDQTGDSWTEQFDLLPGFHHVSFDPRGAGSNAPDLDGNGVVDGADLATLLGYWT